MHSTHLFAALIVSVAVAVGANLASAQCNDCQSGFSSNGMSPSSTRMGGGRMAQHRENFQIWHDDYKEKAETITMRNYAWPKPFICQDRDAYFQVLAATYDAGWIAQNTLTGVHFDPTSGELNLAGQNKVQAIIANNPLDRRTVYVLHNLNVLETQQRLENVQSSVGKWYGAELARNVVVTDRLPQEVSGQRIENINNIYRQSMPPPMIQVGEQAGSAAGGTGASTGASTGGVTQ